MRYRYSQWDGKQEIFPVDEEDVMDDLSEQILFPGDVERALRAMAWRGLTSRAGARIVGVQELLQQLQSRQKEVLSRYNLSSTLDDIGRQLDQIIEKERRGIERRVQEARDRLAGNQGADYGLTPEEEAEILELQEQMAAKNREILDNLPSDAGGRIGQLSKYEFMEAEAQRQFEELMEMLKRRVLETYFKDLSKHLEQLSPEELNRLKEMVRQLNRMMEKRLRGEEPDFDAFMKQFGDYFGPQPPASLEELIKQLAERVAQMQSLLDSLPAEMRESLQRTMDTVLQNEELRRELMQLAATMEHLLPMDELRNHYGFSGEDPIALDEALKLMEELQRMDDLRKQLSRVRRGAGLDEVDSERLKEVLGEEAWQSLEELKHLAEMLEGAGYLNKEDGRLELTPKGIRRLGQKALREIFRHLKRDRLGKHELHHPGQGGDMGEGTKKYEFGDTFMLDLKRTLFNAVQRTGAGLPIRLEPDDFEVYRIEELTQCSTVLMLDLSLSMAIRGSFFAAKRMAMALDSLMRTQFPRDRFHVVGFSTYAREVRPDQLPYLGWDEFDPYTNIQHGLILAQKLLSKEKWGNNQIMLVSDGEPTAHLEGGQLYIQYPPSHRTLEVTLREVKNCTRRGIVINTFMLDSNPYLMRFVSELARMNRGRVFFTTPEKLGEYVLVDYLSQKRSAVR